ncbi:hypothetical protein VSS37_03340 [Candidatus Thiothrix sp. Deng01]|uniref:Uncharacterized protein n=1 Tax=Candidatus Thiothrix phosphatis TaxID=3112415 RepID=A0ABU6CT80_9GAMM|nr:hypothetical protein [Candidatus Thiothrix sp. Deng01]MEB4590004.1 hypothetical protein [Candidatus Thiothrix sp. Deng01]
MSDYYRNIQNFLISSHGKDMAIQEGTKAVVAAMNSENPTEVITMQILMLSATLRGIEGSDFANGFLGACMESKDVIVPILEGAAIH